MILLLIGTAGLGADQSRIFPASGGPILEFPHPKPFCVTVTDRAKTSQG